MENETEVVTQENDIETVTQEIDTEQESVDDLKKKIAELSAQKEHWREKATKKEEEAPKTFDGMQLSPKDYLALTEQKVTSDDFDEVVRVSKILGKNVAETLQDSTMKIILKTRNEERMTALATQTSKGTRSSVSTQPDAVLKKALDGELPERDDDIEKLVLARLEQRSR